MHKWTIESVIVEASRYPTKTAWQKGSKGSYLKACRSGWLPEVYAKVPFTGQRFVAMRLTEEEINAKLPNNLKIKPGTFTGTKSAATFIDAEYGEYTCKAEYVFAGRMHPERLKVVKRMHKHIAEAEISSRLPEGTTLVPGTYTKVHGKAWFERKGERWEAYVYNVIWAKTGPTKKWVSSPKIHTVFTNFLDKHGISYETNRRILEREGKHPLEVDILIPDYNLGIEVHGLYWHSEAHRHFTKHRHKDKYDLAKKQGLTLVQFFEDEINFKPQIVLNVLAAKLGLIKTKIKAKQCEIRELSSAEKTQFFQENHLQGPCPSAIGIGLFYDNTLVQAVTLRKNKKYGIELARFATKQNMSVEFGFSRLMKHALVWCKQHDYSTMVSYCDLRFSTGNVYEKNGFQLDGQTVPDMFWTDKKRRFSRQLSWGKAGKEKTVNLFKIYGVGHLRYLLKIV